MARKSRKNYRRPKMTVPITLAAPLIMPVMDTVTNVMQKDYANAVQTWTGIDRTGKVNVASLGKTYMPIVAGVLIHKYAGPMVNRKLAQAKVPIIRL